MRLIHFRQLEILLVVVESSANIASRATVRKLFTSSRFIPRVRRRCCSANQGDVNSSSNGYGKPMEFYNWDLVLRAILRVNDKLRAYAEKKSIYVC